MHGWLALHHAAHEGHPKVVEQLVAEMPLAGLLAVSSFNPFSTFDASLPFRSLPFPFLPFSASACAVASAAVLSP